MTDNVEIRRLFGLRVRTGRQGRGWSQEELAARMTDAGHGMHQTTIAKIENGDRPTPVEEVVNLAALLETTVTELLAPGDPKVEQARAHLAALRSEEAALQRQVERHEVAAQEARAHLAVTLETIATVEHVVTTLERLPDGERRKKV